MKKKKIKRNFNIVADRMNTISDELCEMYKEIRSLTMYIGVLENDVQLLKEKQVVAPAGVGVIPDLRESYESGVDQDGNDYRVSGPCGC